MDYVAPNSELIRGVVYNSSKPIGGIHYYDSREGSVIIDKLNNKVLVKVAAEAGSGSSTSKAVAETDSNGTSLSGSNTSKAVTEAGSGSTSSKAVTEAGSGSTTSKTVAETMSEPTTNPNLDEELFPKFNIAEEVSGDFDAHKEALLAYRESMQELAVSKTYSNGNPRKNFSSKPGAYVIELNGILVDFSAEGINKPSLNEEDRTWLLKARKYFLEARDEQNRKIGSAEAYTSMELLEALWATAIQVGVDPKRFLVQVYNESRFNPHARGQAGERGIGQFMRETVRALDLDWGRMSAGEETLAYQARCAAEFVKNVGESRYNGGNPEYVRLISSRLGAISRTRVGDFVCDSDACV